MKVMIVGHGYVGSAVASIFNDEEKVIIDPKFNDSVYDNTHWWLGSIEPGLYSNDDFYKQGVIQSADKIEYWKKKSEYHRNHPTVATNKRIAQRLYDYIKGTL